MVLGAAVVSLAVVAIVIAVYATRGGNASGEVTAVSPRDAHQLITGHSGSPGWVILDVRTPAEFSAGHLTGASNIDFEGADFGTRIGALDHDGTYVVYCRTGNRSGQATALMHERGFRHVYNVTGGITAWQQAGLPVTQ